ncbi:MAG: NUDIX domain-containing protein [Candidatus Zambryskibacteria bacterium]|nr:NUDIX domain-containing protein [Candidatus Zambryskibacteria bacterium]
MFSHFKQKLFKYILYPFARVYWKILRPKTYGARALVLYGDNVLLVKNLNLPYWTIPGGGMAKGESPETCVIRELKEELDLDIDSVEYKLGIYTSGHEGKQDEIHIFVVKLLTTRFVKQWELADAQWFPIDSLPENISSATIRRIQELKAGLRNLFLPW